MILIMLALPFHKLNICNKCNENRDQFQSIRDGSCSDVPQYRLSTYYNIP